MATVLFACGPYFRPDGAALSLVTLLVLKPYAYYLFVQCFRYRVSRPIPMTSSQAANIAFIRAIIGAIAIGIGVILVRIFNFDTSIKWSWVYLYAERIVVWTWLGAGLVKLRGRRLLGWTIFGTLLNAAFDFSIVAGLLTGIIPPIIVLAAISVFIATLHSAGRREALLNRFSSDPCCIKCEYNLTGNLSGICPECGTPVTESIATQTTIAN